LDLKVFRNWQQTKKIYIKNKNRIVPPACQLIFKFKIFKNEQNQLENAKLINLNLVNPKEKLNFHSEILRGRSSVKCPEFKCFGCNNKFRWY